MNEFSTLLTSCVLLATNCGDNPPQDCTLLEVGCLDVADMMWSATGVPEPASDPALQTCVVLATDCGDNPPNDCTMIDGGCLDIAAVTQSVADIGVPASVLGYESEVTLQASDPDPYWKRPFAHLDLPNAGARTPFVTYDIDQAELGGSAKAVRTPKRLASEAINRQAVLLSHIGDYVELKAANRANSLLLRFSLTPGLPRAQRMSLSVYVNGEDVGDLWLSPNYIHNVRGNPKDNTFHPATARTNIDAIWRWWAEDVLRGIDIKPGDIVRLQRDRGDNAPEYYLDLVDLEQIPEPLQKPPGYVSVTDHGATPNDPSDDDLPSFWKAIDAAAAGSKKVWIPSGTFHLDGRVTLSAPQRGITFAGAGMWHSEVFINRTHNQTNQAKGAFWVRTPDVTFRDFKMTRVANYRRLPQTPDNHGGPAVKGNGDNLTMERLWINHSGTTTWYAGSNAVIRDNRVRNNYADGLHIFSQGSNNIIENNHIRGCGDDGLAHWGAQDSGRDNIWRNNTIEAGYFGRGMIAFGTNGEQYINNLVVDNHGIGMLAATTRVTKPMTGTLFRENVIIRSGENAIELRPRDTTLQVKFENNYLIDTMTDAINIRAGNTIDANFRGNVVKWVHQPPHQPIVNNARPGSKITIQ
jgi:parallel beta-helix repeat protein